MRAVEKNDIPKALFEYKSAEDLFPENLEMKYWHAVMLANTGRVAESLPVFKSVFRKDGNWRTLTERLPEAGQLNVNAGDLRVILAQ
jgi:hypothetical protein